LKISTFASLEGVGGTDGGGVDEDEAVDGANDGLDEIEDLPFNNAGTDPKDFTPSDLIGGAAAGEEDIGAESSSIDPNVTAEPCFSAPTLPRGTLTPSLMGTP